jgi:hypothetical protein
MGNVHEPNRDHLPRRDADRQCHEDLAHRCQVFRLALARVLAATAARPRALPATYRDSRVVSHGASPAFTRPTVTT